MTGRGASSAGRVALLWDDALVGYDLGPEHPLAPVRVELTMALIRHSGLLGPNAVEIPPGAFDEAELLRLHRPDFVDTVKRLSADTTARAGDRYGLGPGDTPAFAGMHPTSMLVCAASKEAAGFCIYNDPAIAIDWLLEHGAERIAYVDVDVHHGDGVEVAFADDPRVLTISLHESGRFLFPGTGRVEDIGGDGARGSVANVPLYPGTTGDIWLSAFDAVVDPLVRAFAPDILVTQLGCDTHATDPLAHLSLTVDDDAEIYRRLHELAHEVCAGRWVAFGGGGYQIVDVVPRAWTLAFAEMAGQHVPIDTPMVWQELAFARTGRTPPRSFTDDPATINPELHAQARRAAEESVDALRRLVLPLHGLGPSRTVG